MMRGGKLYDAQFGKRMRGEGIFADQMDQMFAVACRKAGIADSLIRLSIGIEATDDLIEDFDQALGK